MERTILLGQHKIIQENTIVLVLYNSEYLVHIHTYCFLNFVVGRKILLHIMDD
jgi:hypothetical protein